MSGLNINAAFIREELLDGSIGMRLGHLAQARARAATDEQIDEALDLTFGDDDHPIHAALDALVESTYDRLAEIMRRSEEMQRLSAAMWRAEKMKELVRLIRSALPSGTPIEIIGDAIAIGELRTDGLAPLAVFDRDEDGWELLAPDPHGPQRNATDRVREVAVTLEVPDAVRELWDEITS